MRSIIQLYIFSLIIYSCTLNAQKPIWNDIVLEDEINLTSLQSDTIGFVWGLSKDGLFKFDGFKLIKKLAVQKASSTFISFEKDNLQNFLIGTSEGELILYNPYSDQIISSHFKKEKTPITFIDCEDVGNNCLTLSYGNGVHWISTDLDTFLNIENILISNEVYEAILDDSRIILATDQGIQVIEKKDHKLTSKIINKSDGLGDVIISNIIDQDSVMWASNFDSQIYRINSPSDITTFDLPLKTKINGIKAIDKTRIFVFTNDGLFSLEKDSWIKKYPVFGSQEVHDATIDDEYNLWVCSANNSLSKANLGFQIINNTVDKAQAILKNENKIWIGSSEGLFIVNGMNKIKVLDYNITCLQMLNDDILVGTFSSGIHILSKDGELIGSIDGWDNNPKQSVLYLYPTKDFLYISSLTGVTKMKLSKNNGRYTSSKYQNLNSLLGPGYVYQILESEGVFYFATDRQGIKILGNGSLQHITNFENGNTLGSIYSMTKCDKGRIWFSSSTGYIGYVENGMVNYINNERYLQDPYTSIITSADQKIIMVRNSSIDIYDPQSDHFVYHNDIFQTSDQELYLNCFTEDDNAICLAKSNGILVIEGLQNQKIIPKCLINQVMVNLTDVGNKHKLEEDQNNLEFIYSAAWMTNPERITYQYKLDGVDEKWRNTRDRSAIYPMLRPGKYEFRVKASIDGKFSNETESTFAFTIKQNFYKTWWFILLLLLLLGGIIRNWRNDRKKVRLQKEDLNKKRIEAQLISLQTQLNPHFLFNSFNTLIGLIEENPEKGITFTEKLTDFYRNILEVGKNDLIPLKEEIKLLDTYIHLIKERFGEQLLIDLQFEDVEPYKTPPLTLQLLIENAVKHNVVSTKKPLHISVIQEGSTIKITNKISPKYGNSKGTGIGLENIQKRHTLNNLRPPKIDQSGEHFIVTIYLNDIEL